MKQLVGIIGIVLAIVLGLYVGVWLMFVGGIVQVIGEVRADDLSAVNVGIGIARILLAGFVGWLSAFIIGVPSFILLKD